jgi:hypothetical protein
MEINIMRFATKTRMLTALLAVLLTAAPALGQYLEPEITVLARFTAEQPGDGYGFVASEIGDLDGDGAPEYIITAPFNGEGGPAAGKAYVYDGATGGLIHTVVGAPLETLGWGVSKAGDINKDRVPDYAIGAPSLFAGPTGQGRVLVLSGADHSLLWEFRGVPGDGLGFDIGLAGDVDHEKRGDLILGANRADGFAGRVDLISGKKGETVWSFAGPDPVGRLGGGVDGIGDLDGDGRDDVAVAAFTGGPTGNGRVYLLSGRDGALLRTLDPVPGGNGALGWFFVHGVGDMDLDGAPDVYVGDFSDSTAGAFAGRGYVFSGGDGSIIHLIDGENPGDGLGMGRGAGDVTGDGVPDLLVGAYLNSEGAAQGGKCYLYSGADGSLIRTFTSDQPNGQIGFDVVTLGDVNGDGLTDFLLTGNDVAQVVAGR